LTLEAAGAKNGNYSINYTLDLGNGQILNNAQGTVGDANHYGNWILLVRELNVGEQYYWY
jgi:hypothetical protein